MTACIGGAPEGCIVTGCGTNTGGWLVAAVLPTCWLPVGLDAATAVGFLGKVGFDGDGGDSYAMPKCSRNQDSKQTTCR